VCFPPYVPMVYSPKLTFVANGNNPTSVGLALGGTIYFGSLEFTGDRFGRLGLSPDGEDSGAIFIGMVQSGSPSLHTTLKELSDEGNTTSGEGGELQTPWPPRVQCGDPDCLHHHCAATGEHSGTSNHPNCPVTDRRIATRYRAPHRVAAGLPGGATSMEPCSAGCHQAPDYSAVGRAC
jgi:hypothetical protein